jgi:hypothetical protein
MLKRATDFIGGGFANSDVRFSLLDICKSNVRHYLGDSVEQIPGKLIEVVKDAIPTLKTPENAYFIYDGELPSLKSAVVGCADAMSTVHPNYLFVAATFVAAFFILYIKMQYPFWNQMPAMHVYDFHRRFLYPETPYIIHLLPKKNKYYESRLVKTANFSALSKDAREEMVALLQNHYFPSDRVFCSIKLPDLAAQCANSLVSTYDQVCDDLSVDASSGQFVHKTTRLKIEGFVASRPASVSVSVGTGDARYVAFEPAQYVDYLCFERTATPHKIRKLFNTHEHNQRLLSPSRNVTLFKKEVELCDALVPLVKYDAFTFYLRHKMQPANLPTSWQIVRIQKEHQPYLHDYMERVASLKADVGFRVSITAEIGDIITLLQTNQLFAYVLRGPDKEPGGRLDAVYAIYFFRNAHMKYEDLAGADTVHCVAAFCNTNNFDLYFLGFLWAVVSVVKDFPDRPKMLMMDDVGHMRSIVRKWQDTHDVVLKTPCAYYLCNYVVPRSTFREEDVNILL